MNDPLESIESCRIRRTTRRVELRGVTIPENAVRFARFGAAN